MVELPKYEHSVETECYPNYSVKVYPYLDGWKDTKCENNPDHGAIYLEVNSPRRGVVAFFSFTLEELKGLNEHFTNVIKFLEE